MQATGTLGGARTSKRVVALFVALLAAFVLGGAGGYIARNASIGQAAPQAPAQAAAQSYSGWDSYRSVRGGLQLGDDTTSSASSGAPGLGDCIRVNRVKAC